MIKMFRSLFLIGIFIFLGLVGQSADAANCQFGTGNIREVFKNCNPSIGVKPDTNLDLSVTKQGSDFKTITATIIRRVQIVTSILAIGVIVWIGLIMVLPTSAEAKESAKSKVFSVVLGFLVMIAATIIVNGIINLLYEIFK